MKRIILANLIFFLTSLTLAGCSAYHEAVKSINTSVNDIFSPAEDTRMAQELAWDGMDDYDSGNYRDAIEAFQRLKDIYPFSKYPFWPS
jgi:outer membrane protein assembly factor BamD (BamD/ComL family)